MEPVIKLERVTFSYNGEPVLADVNLSVQPNEFVWIVGPNGGGKTTLLKLMLGLLRPQQGKISVFGASPQASARRIGYMPQHAQLDLHFPVTAMDIAMMGRLSGSLHAGPYSAADRRAALAALAQVGLEGLKRRALGELSGGQQRRLLIARAIASEPELLVLDEPTAHLDRVVERELYAILRELNQRLTIVMVSHDPAFVSDFVQQVVCVNRSVAVHPTTTLAGEAMLELYGAPKRLVRHDQHHREGEPRK